MKEKIKIVFMGTPVFAAEILQDLIDKQFNIVGVVSQPNRQKDRKGNLLNTPTAEVALRNGLEIFQPEKIKLDYSFLEKTNPDLIITAAYGQIVGEEILNYPKYGCINVHGSLLPKYRGGAPMHYAILNGDEKTGVTIMEMVNKMDAGDIICQKEFEILLTDTLENVHDNMIKVSKDILDKTILAIVNGEINKIKQEENLVTYSPTIKKEEQLIDWQDEGINIYNKIRAFNPWPVAYSIIHEKRFKFFETVYKVNGNEEHVGQIIKITAEGIFIGVKGGILQVKEFQIQGKKRQKVSEFINGNNLLFVDDEFKSE